MWYLGLRLSAVLISEHCSYVLKLCKLLILLLFSCASLKTQ